MTRGISRIKKRDGSVVDFVQDKITKAVFKAMESCGIKDEAAAKTVSDIATFMLEDKFGGYTIPSVEQIQDIVEMVLMKRGYLEVAKSYILYRERHKGIREAKQTGINLERLIKDYISDDDWKIRENSNEGDDELLRAQRPRSRARSCPISPLTSIYTAPVKKAHHGGRFPHPRPVLSRSSATAPAGRSRSCCARGSATSPTRSTRARPSIWKRRPSTWSTTSGRCRASSPAPRRSPAWTRSSRRSSGPTSSTYEQRQAGHPEARLRPERPLALGLADALLQPDLRLDRPRGHEGQESGRRRRRARLRPTATSRPRWT